MNGLLKSFCSVTPAKKPADTAPKQKKAPVKAKKPDTCIWDSDSDTGTKKAPAAPKGGGKGRGRKRKQSSSEEEDYNPVKKTGKTATSRVRDISSTNKPISHVCVLLLVKNTISMQII